MIDPKLIFKSMFQNDAFSQWLGIECEQISLGYCLLKMKIKAEMLNGFDIVHGGILFSLADSALAFAANSSGFVEVSINAQIQYHQAAKIDEIIIAEAKLISKTSKFQYYQVSVKNENDELICSFSGTAFKSNNTHKI